MRSAFYHGWVTHKRFSPKVHGFRYRVFSMYFDLDELSSLLSVSRWISRSPMAFIGFNRKDFHGDESKPIRDEVYKTVKQQTGIELEGPVAVLSNWRCLGFNFNPLSTYYCFDREGLNLVAVLAEVTNTPWHERHAYAMDVRAAGANKIEFDKTFTVSPFNPIDMQYRWSNSTPDRHLRIGIENLVRGKKVFSASMNLRREEITSKSTRFIVFAYPLMTFKVVVAIYWQALKIYFKKIPFLGKDKLLKEANWS